MSEFEIHDIATAEEFLHLLRRSNPLWLTRKEDFQSPWIFRGQKDAKLGLVPSAWRDDVKNHDLFKWLDEAKLEREVDRFLKEKTPRSAGAATSRAHVRTVVRQHHFEFQIVLAFAWGVDSIGCQVPGGFMPRRVDCELFEQYDEATPSHQAFALAQHHGMPTRLLDWTHNPLIAAFFAAQDASDNEEGHIAVWAVDTNYLKSRECRLFSVPRSSIGFLRAQEGLFTYIPNANEHFVRNGEWPRLEELIEPTALRKITLPSREVSELTRLLWAERISRAHLMPTHDNVTQSLKSIWRRAPGTQSSRTNVRATEDPNPNCSSD